ncbi:MAG: hypothetical protein LBI63_01795 [Candidatus Ancillula sp.]|jgi:hypothetical protein|nr:hypothetical protein [Candidatus Ancillula sp.]
MVNTQTTEKDNDLNTSIESKLDKTADADVKTPVDKNADKSKIDAQVLKESTTTTQNTTTKDKQKHKRVEVFKRYTQNGIFRVTRNIETGEQKVVQVSK